MQDKTRIKHRYFTRGKSFESGTSVMHLCAHEPLHQTAKSCAFLWKGENSKREQDEKTSKQDTGFVPREILIWKCAKPSEMTLLCG